MLILVLSIPIISQYLRDGAISVIGRITKSEMENFIKAQYFEIKEVLDKNSKKGR